VYAAYVVRRLTAGNFCTDCQGKAGYLRLGNFEKSWIYSTISTKISTGSPTRPVFGAGGVHSAGFALEPRVLHRVGIGLQTWEKITQFTREAETIRRLGVFSSFLFVGRSARSLESWQVVDSLYERQSA